MHPFYSSRLIQFSRMVLVASMMLAIFQLPAHAQEKMAARFASINDLPILESERKYHWVLGRRPDDHPGLGDLGL